MSSLSPYKPAWQETEAELDALLRQKPEEFRSLIEPLASRDVPYIPELSDFKRFIERWRADRAFREALPGDPAGVAARHGLRANPEDLRYFWDETFARQMDEQGGYEEPLVVRRHKFFIREKLLHREKLRSVECLPGDPRHRAWRERQMRRCLGHLGPKQHDAIIHAPFAIELSDGCSVGCWFCGVSAEKKKGDFLYGEENAALWREVLGVIREKIGEAARTGFLYWASDPMDNPDYEKFGADFARICGRFPQTTTAIAHKNVERTRALLRLSTELGCTINRFSVLSLGQFNKLMEAFTPEELLYCEIISQNNEASHIQSNSGRARRNDRLRSRAEKNGAEGDDWSEIPGTIACVSGFLINMVRRRVRLITPCPSSDRWPDGYWIFEEGHFTDAADLARLLDGMMERHMKRAVRAGDLVRFRADLRYEPLENGFRLHAFGAKSTYGEDPRFQVPQMKELGELIAQGRWTAGEIALGLEERFDRPLENTFNILNQIFDAGYLDEEPAPLPQSPPAPPPVPALAPVVAGG